MSTKIWNAFRAPLNKANDAIDLLHDHMWERVYRDYCKLLAAADVEKIKEKHKCADTEVRFYRHYFVSDGVKELKAVCSKHQQDMHILECSLNLWMHKRYVYLIPYGPYDYYSGLYADNSGDGILSSLCPSWLEDFHYQNSTDPPEHISRQVYRARAKVWDQINLGGALAKNSWNARRLNHIVFECATSY